MGEMYDFLKEGLDEVLEHAQGKKTLRTKKMYLPDPPKQYQSKDIKRLRKKLNYSQRVFALIINVSPKTIQAWETGERHPSSIANRLLEIVDSKNKQERFFKSISN